MNRHAKYPLKKFLPTALVWFSHGILSNYPICCVLSFNFKMLRKYFLPISTVGFEDRFLGHLYNPNGPICHHACSYHLIKTAMGKYNIEYYRCNRCGDEQLNNLINICKKCNRKDTMVKYGNRSNT